MKFIRKLLGLEGPKPPVRSARDRDFDLRGLERLLHYEFKDPALARQAMTHRSYLHATPGRSGESNERMEFLGDSVVGLVVNEFLYKKFTKLREGELTKMKSLLVSRVILSRSANQLGLGHYILLSDAEKGSGGRNRASILADTLEGIIGAMYLDGGIEPARKLTERLLLREVNTILGDANLANYKSMLQEYVQGEFKTHPQYRISSEYGPDHQKMFTVEVVVSGKTFGRGHGSNKKEAEQEAARDALFHFEKLVRPEPAKEGAEGEKRRRRRGGRGRRNGRREEGRGEGRGRSDEVRGRSDEGRGRSDEVRRGDEGHRGDEGRHRGDEGRHRGDEVHRGDEDRSDEGRRESGQKPAAQEAAPAGEISYGRRDRRQRRHRGSASGDPIRDPSREREPREPRREREPSNKERSREREPNERETPREHEPVRDYESSRDLEPRREYESPRSEEPSEAEYEPPRERERPRDDDEPRSRETRDVDSERERGPGREPGGQGDHGEDEGRRGPYAASRLHAEP